MNEEEQQIKAEVEAAEATLRAEMAKLTGYVKIHYAVIGAAVCLVIGFAAGYLV